MASITTKGEAVTKVRFANCRHPFGDSLQYDVVVNGNYPDRHHLVCLSQAEKPYGDLKLPNRCATFAIPEGSVDCARAVVSALTVYILSDTFRDDVPIEVYLSWPYAPTVEWELIVTKDEGFPKLIINW